MEIVGNEWQELGIIAPDTTSALNINNRLLNSDDEAQFQVAVINNEDNADYIPPKGVKGEYDRINQIESKEQSLALKYANLPPKHTGIAQKTLYTLNDNQKRSFMTYDYMKMYVHGDEKKSGRLRLTEPYTRSTPHYPPIKALKPWAEAKGLNPYAVQQSIGKKGTPLVPFFLIAM